MTRDRKRKALFPAQVIPSPSTRSQTARAPAMSSAPYIRHITDPTGAPTHPILPNQPLTTSRRGALRARRHPRRRVRRYAVLIPHTDRAHPHPHPHLPPTPTSPTLTPTPPNTARRPLRQPPLRGRPLPRAGAAPREHPRCAPRRRRRARDRRWARARRSARRRAVVPAWRERLLYVSLCAAYLTLTNRGRAHLTLRASC